MPAIPLGRVNVAAAGTPARATANQSDPTKRIAAHGIMFEVWPTNVGLTYVGTEGMNKTTGFNVLAVLPLPSLDSNGDPVFLPTFSLALTIAPNGLNPADFYIDADDNNAGLLVSVLQA